MRQIVLPIKDDEVLKQVQDTLLNNFKSGRRNYTIFQVGKATLLRVSDVLRLKQEDVFDDYGAIKQHAFIKDKKTGKRNTLYLNPVMMDLVMYQQWLKRNGYEGTTEWLFPSTTRPQKHIDERQLQRDGQSRGLVGHQLPGHAHDAQDWSLPCIRPVQLQHWSGHEAAEPLQRGHDLGLPGA